MDGIIEHWLVFVVVLAEVGGIVSPESLSLPLGFTGRSGWAAASGLAYT